MLMASTGMRRGEVLGLRWTDIDLKGSTITIRSTRIRFGKTTATSTPKTARGNRTIAIGPATLSALRAWKRTQTTERLQVGARWQGEHGLVVTNIDGAAPNPEGFSNLFARLVRAARLPSIRLHDLRHSYATAALAAGVPVKVLSQRIGHADVGVTLAVYAHVMPGDDEDAARRAEALFAEP
jgi:integrase